MRFSIAPAIALTLAVLASLSAPAGANPVLGFREEWTGIETNGWGGGSVISNPGTGGVFGAGDGYLAVSTNTVTKLGTTSFGLEYTGDWIAAGITQVWCWLNDINNDEPIEVHFSLGNQSNFWQYNIGFIAPHNEWGRFVVDLSSSTNWTHTIDVGGGSFNAALMNVDRIHFRHDLAPYVQTPDNIQGDFGLDHLLLTNGTVGVPHATPQTGPRAVQLAPPAPNPSRGAVNLSLRSFDQNPITIQVLDVSGRIVREEVMPGLAGPRSWTWDGLDDGGRATSAGVYRVRAFSASGGTSRPLVRIP